MNAVRSLLRFYGCAFGVRFLRFPSQGSRFVIALRAVQFLLLSAFSGSLIVPGFDGRVSESPYAGARV